MDHMILIISERKRPLELEKCRNRPVEIGQAESAIFIKIIYFSYIERIYSSEYTVKCTFCKKIVHDFN